MKADLYCVFDNITPARYLYRGFTVVEILQMSDDDFNVFFPEKKYKKKEKKN